jgi:hypothetical protein
MRTSGAAEANVVPAEGSPSAPRGFLAPAREPLASPSANQKPIISREASP